MVVALYLFCQMVEILCRMHSRSSDSLILVHSQTSEIGRYLVIVDSLSSQPEPTLIAYDRLRIDAAN